MYIVWCHILLTQFKMLNQFSESIVNITDSKGIYYQKSSLVIIV